jgi:hypothetical protein
MVNRSKGINKDYLHLTIDFVKAYNEVANELGLAILTGTLVSKKLIEKKVVETLTPIINDYFSKSIAASNKIVPAKISLLTDQLGVPFKYNRDVLDKINDKAIWTGYYDKDIKKAFSTVEINKMKSAILGAKYSGMEEKQLITSLKNVVNVTDGKARQIARGMTARMDTVVNEIYLSKKKVRDEYELVWSQNSPYERHKHMNGVVADADGKFLDSKTGTKISGPPYQYSPWNCLCTTYWRKI